MAILNPNTTQFHLTKNTVPGTTNATPTWHRLEADKGDMIDSIAQTIKSSNVTGNRASAGSLNVGFSGGGTINSHMRPCQAMDWAIESGFSGEFDNDGELIGGTYDPVFTMERRIKNGGGYSYDRFEYTMATSLKFTTDTRGMFRVASEWMNVKCLSSGTAITGSTYTPLDLTKTLLYGVNIANFTVSGLSGIKCRSIDLTVTQQREEMDELGEEYAFALATGDDRNIVLNAGFYRQGNDFQQLLWGSNAKLAVSFDIGTVGNGYKFEFPRMAASVKGAVDGAKLMDNVELTAEVDPVTGYDVKITKL